MEPDFKKDLVLFYLDKYRGSAGRRDNGSLVFRAFKKNFEMNSSLWLSQSNPNSDFRYRFPLEI